MKTYAFVFARGGSKGLPGKNLMEIDGISLIGRAVRIALEVPEIEKVIVSTDDPQIAAEAVSHGAVAPFMRPAELAGDTSPEWESWRHAVRHLHENGDPFDRFVSVPATAPLRLAEDVRNAIRVFEASDCDLVMSMTEAERSPYFTIVSEQEDGFFLPAMRGEKPIHRRQDAPVVFDVTPVAYVTTPAHIERAFGYYDGRIKANFVPRERAVDIDTEVDLEVARALFARQKATGLR
jgi:N-acylneuraminate cytidylyltransferase